MKTFFVAYIVLHLFSTFTTFSQDAFPRVDLNTRISITFTTSQKQYFATFSADQGDVVFLTAEYDGFVIGSLDLDLRDSVGRSIGQKVSFNLKDYMVAEVTTDGEYVLVVTAEKPEAATIFLGKTGYINDNYTISIYDDEPAKPFLVRVEARGNYNIEYERLSGDLDVNFSIVNISKLFPETVVDISGLGISSWSINVDLQPRFQYVVFIGEEFISFGSGDNASVRITFSD